MADLEKKAPAPAPRPVPRPAGPMPVEPATMLMTRAERPWESEPAPAKAPAPMVAPAPAPSAAAEDALAALPELPGQTKATDLLAGAKETRHDDLVAANPSAGDRIGKYVVERVVGSGGMGLVVSARHEGLNERVAIKVLRPKAARDQVHAERFAREARAIVKIKSEHVVRVLDAGTSEAGAPYLVMEFLVGEDLAHLLRREGPMPVPRAAGLMLQICEAVASAHAVGVVHRDLKPSNFFLTTRADGEPLLKVLDFGISKAIGQDGIADPNLTETQAVFGSPTYMPPEQIRSAKHVDQRSDIWALGVGFYEILTGRLPFAADNVAGLLASIVADPPFFPRAFVPSLPVELEALLLQCLAKDARERPQTVAELAFRLAPFAPPGPARDDLLDRIDRLARTTGVGHTTGPRLPTALPAPVPSSVPGLPAPAPSSVPGFPAAPRPPSQPELPAAARSSGVSFGAAAFGSTGMDLSAEAGLPRRGGAVAAAIVGIVVAVLVLVGVVGAYELGTRHKADGAASGGGGPSATPAPPASVAAPPASVSASPTAAAIASVPALPTSSSAAAGVAEPASTSSGARPSTRPHPRPHGSAPRPGPTKAVDPTNDRY